jgi:tRNA-specific 2-thiouridylase
MKKEFKRRKIVVAMSGGVDSSTVAAMLHSEGHEVIGVTLQLYDYGMTVGKKGACCAGQDIYDAKIVANKLGFPHYVLDYESRFKQAVIDDFVENYINGRTPLPCVKCNQSVKFVDLLKVTKDLGAELLATGHYVRKINGKDGPEIWQGIDKNKDQSYFLFATTKEQLEFLYFPLGEMTKEKTRELASSFKLEIADKPDSQDICFVPNGNYREVISKIRPDSFEKGKILHIEGFELGEHDGIINYTIGQRKGIKISSPEPLYVIKIDTDNKIVYVGPNFALDCIEFNIKEVNWLCDLPKNNTIRDVKIKIRSTGNGVLGEIQKLDNNSAKVKLYSKERAISPGQACVFYNGERMLGGGWIV